MWLLLLALALAPARAASPEDAVRAAVAARLGVPEADVEVSAMGTLAGLPEGESCAAELPGTGSVEGRVTVRLRCGQGWWTARPAIDVWRTLPVAAADTPARAPVEVVSARVPSSRLRGEAPVRGEGPWLARVDLEAGAPLTELRVAPRPDARRGDAVTLVAGRGGLAVRASGELLGDAFVGGEVAALNASTRVIVRGVYRGDGVVTVGGR